MKLGLWTRGVNLQTDFVQADPHEGMGLDRFLASWTPTFPDFRLQPEPYLGFRYQRAALGLP